jgi:hypothetical protein
MRKITFVWGATIEVEPIDHAAASDQFYVVATISQVRSPDPLMAAAEVMAEVVTPLVKSGAKLVRRPV